MPFALPSGTWKDGERLDVLVLVAASVGVFALSAWAMLHDARKQIEREDVIERLERYTEDFV